MFLLAILDNLPRLRVSDALFRVFLWILRESGVQDVPSFDAYRKMRARLRGSFGIPTLSCKSVQGNVFYMNDPRRIIVKVCVHTAMTFMCTDILYTIFLGLGESYGSHTYTRVP